MSANLDDLCPHDGRPIGDHTLREWDQHMHDSGHHLPYEENPDGPRWVADDGLPLADQVTARSQIFQAEAGAMTLTFPCLALDFFASGVDATAPQARLVDRIGLVSTPDVMRQIGKLLRDTAYGAAKAAERVA